MAKSKITDLRDMATLDLQGQLEQAELQYQKLKFEHAVKGLGNPLMLRNLRREIAQIHTVLRAKEIAILSSEELEGRSKLVRRRRQNL
ncbi:MAG: 50S ribosomal protein L29 [Bacteroidetes bacterium]|nr:50S ribosomal protein L29 [Bacteroidota bacterium]